MPYITQQRREELREPLDNFLKELSTRDLSAGDLNYMISKIVWCEYNKNKGYTQANSLLGVLDGVTREFYRRKVAPYEDAKIKENGDIE
jgi:hypothetical protein